MKAVVGIFLKISLLICLTVWCNETADVPEASQKSFGQELTTQTGAGEEESGSDEPGGNNTDIKMRADDVYDDNEDRDGDDDYDEYDDDDYNVEVNIPNNMKNYKYTVFAKSAQYGPQNYSGLLVNDQIVASIKVDNAADVDLCFNGYCRKTTKLKDTKEFTYWKLAEKRKSAPKPSKSRNTFRTAKCMVDDSIVIVKRVANSTTDNEISCEPSCKDGEMVLCKNDIMGLVRERENGIIRLITLENLIDDGGLGPKPPGKRVKYTRPKPTAAKFQPSAAKDTEQHVRTTNNTATADAVATFVVSPLIFSPILCRFFG